MKFQIKLIIFCCVLFFTLSCEYHNEDIPKNDTTNSLNKANSLSEDDRRVEFAKALAVAVKDVKVRKLLKQEALKMFNNDYEILVEMIRNNKVDNSSSLENIMNKSAKNIPIKDIIDATPLMTILVPNLPKFSAENWDTETQIPKVAVSFQDPANPSKVSMIAFDEMGNQSILNPREKPDFPVIAVKINERMVIIPKKGRIDKNITKGSMSILENDNYTYYFEGDSYDSRIKKKTRNERLGLYSSFDARARYARENGINPHRDYIYYGLDPANGVNSGYLMSNYSEFITSIRFDNITALNNLKDESWDESFLEFQIFIASFNGRSSDQLLTKVITVNPANLVYNGQTQQYLTNEEIFPWSQDLYGDRLLFKIYEKDNSGTQTTSTTVSANFSTKVSGDLKVISGDINIGFSGSRTITYTINQTSDYLGDAILYYDTNIITDYIPAAPPIFPNPMASNYEIGSGGIKLSIEAKYRY